MNEEENKEETLTEEVAAEQEQSAEESASSSESQQASAEPPAPPSLEEQLEEMKGNYLRALAEQENYRKRMAREMNDLKENTRIRTLQEVCGIYDLLQMAVDAAKNAQDVSALRQGVEMTFGELKRTFEGFGMKVLDAVGKPFDPALHQAVGAEASDDVPEGTVLRQWKPGFQIGERLLRAAMVVVSSGPAKATDSSDEKKDAE